MQYVMVNIVLLILMQKVYKIRGKNSNKKTLTDRLNCSLQVCLESSRKFDQSVLSPQ